MLRRAGWRACTRGGHELARERRKITAAVDIVVESARSTMTQAIESLAFGDFVGVVGFLGGFEVADS
jgi:hypothetical protein